MRVYVRDTVWTADNEENTVLSEILFEALRAENMIEDITVLSECLLHTVSNFQNMVFNAFGNNLLKESTQNMYLKSGFYCDAQNFKPVWQQSNGKLGRLNTSQLIN